MIVIKSNKNTSVSSVSGTDSRHRNKNAVVRSGNKASSDKSLSKLKTALVLIPFLIVLSIIIVLIIAFNQYWASVAPSESQDDGQSQTYTRNSGDSKKVLTLVSPKSPLPSDYSLDLADYDNTQVDVLIIEPLRELVKDAEKNGLSLSVTEGYVSVQEQNELYHQEINRLTETEGQNSARAAEEARTRVPMGNYADSQTGLSVRFSSDSGSDFSKTDEYYWLIKNSYKYGFILRYPENKTLCTEMDYDPSLFRFVGKDNALKMQRQNMCLDEYIVYLNAR